MRIKPGPLDRRSFPTVRGVVLSYDGKWGPRLQKWPRKRGKATSGGKYYKEQEFGMVAKMVSTPHFLDYGTAVEMAKDTTYIPRDILMMCAYGTYYQICGPDGVDWPRYRDVTVNAQLTLDQVTDIVGSVMYRAEIGWVGLGPGSQGYVLTMNEGLPLWAPAASGDGGIQDYWINNPASTSSTSNNACGGIVFILGIDATATHGFYTAALNVGSTYNVELWSMTGNNLNAKVAETPTFVAASGSKTVYNYVFDAPADLVAGTRYCLLAVRRTGTGTSIHGIYTCTTGFTSIPFTDNLQTARLPQNTPATGQTVTVGTNSLGQAISLALH